MRKNHKNFDTPTIFRFAGINLFNFNVTSNPMGYPKKEMAIICLWSN